MYLHTFKLSDTHEVIELVSLNNNPVETYLEYCINQQIVPQKISDHKVRIIFASEILAEVAAETERIAKTN